MERVLVVRVIGRMILKFHEKSKFVDVLSAVCRDF